MYDPSDLDGVSELYDAVIEDTVHCDLCGGSWVLGGNDGGVILDHEGIYTGPVRLGCQLKLCEHCSQRVHDAYRENLREACICEHGINDGEYCGECNGEYKRARGEN